MKCEDCNKECKHYVSTSLIEEKYGVIVDQTRLYFRCPECKTVYVHVLIPQPRNEEEVISEEYLEKYPYIEKKPFVENKITLDEWM